MHQKRERTFPRNIRRNDLLRAQLDPGDLALGRVGFLGRHGADLEADALDAGPADQRGGDGAPCFLRFAAPAQDLVVGGHCAGEGEEGAGGGGGAGEAVGFGEEGGDDGGGGGGAQEGGEGAEEGEHC